MNAIIFLGPSISASDARKHLDALYMPPVSQGDIIRAAKLHPKVIGIIDGFFEHVPAVWHKEILWAMAQGIHVYGSASIGALRAAELAPFGMKGVGQVYEAFRDGILEDDDEVAVLHGPEELGYPVVTEAMVNIRATLAAATDSCIFGPSQAAHMTDIAKALFYKDRTYSAILQTAVRQGLKQGSLRDFTEWLRQGRIDLKLHDALAMVAIIQHRLALGVPPLRVSYAMAHTSSWEAFRQPPKRNSPETS